MVSAPRLVGLLVACGCGRLGFSEVIPSDAANPGDASVDGALAASCTPALLTCGVTASSSCCESRSVPGGSYLRSYDVGMDGANSDSGFPATVSPFRLDRYEVTVGRFRRFVDAGYGTQAVPPAAGDGARSLNGLAAQGGWDAAWNGALAVDTPSLVARLNCDPPLPTYTAVVGANENRPVNCVSWIEAMAFCLWDGGFLPTEAEWNFAAVGGSEHRAFPWSVPASSTSIDTTRASYLQGGNCIGDLMAPCTVDDLVPVGTRPSGDGPYGQADLAGNVFEWVLDWQALPYPTTTCDDCANLTPATWRQARGGAYNYPPLTLRGASRINAAPQTTRYSDIGVRCARW